MENQDQGFNPQNLIPLIDGHIKKGYAFQNNRGITESDPYYRQNSTRNDKINCVVFVVDASTLDVLPYEYTQKIRALQDILVPKGIPQVLILAKCDKLCKLVNKNTADIFRSTLIEACVEYAACRFGIQQSFIHPVVSYENRLDSGVHKNVNIPILLALRQMVHFAGDYLENGEQRERRSQVDEI
ncbi:interferon-induced protein 44-like [Mercenaria mercenaria]|uniref:interferon-induced protein 44-like n=1 Tax=Mercenaria mercenaria TaxID=6596 RepID=UPI00234E9AF9|nr:interferon-induced protein 44-like [Mercenaria mercenaria]